MNWAKIILGPITVKILDWLFATPAQKDAKAAEFSDFDVPRAKYGDPAPLIWGTVRQKSPVTLWYGDYKPQPIKKKQSTGLFSSKKVIVGYKNFIGIDYLIGFSSGHTLKTIWCNEDIVWQGTQSAYGILSISKPNLFGGDDQQGGISGPMAWYPGDDSPIQDPYLIKVLGPKVPAYNGLCRALFQGFYIGTTTQLPTFSFEVQRLTKGLSATYSVMPNGLDVNPLEICYDVLVSSYGRFGNSPLIIDTASWLAAAQTLYNEGLGMSFQLQQGSTGKSVITECMNLADGVIYQEPSTRKMVVKLIRNDYVVGSLPVYDESVISDVSGFSKNTWQGTFNQCRVTFGDRANGYDDSSAVAQDFANINFQQRVVSSNVDAPGIADSTVAVKMAASQLSRGNIPLYKCVVTCNRKAQDARPGSTFVMNWSPFGLTGMVMRVLKVDLGELTSGKIKLTVVQDRYSTSTPIFAPPDPTQWVPPVTDALAVATRKVTELPYFFANRDTPPGTTDSVLAVVAEPPSSASIAFNADWTTNADSGWTNPTRALTDAPYYGSGTLTAPYAATAGFATGLDSGGFTVNSTSFPTVPPSGTFDRAGGTLLMVDNEIMGFTTFVNNNNGTYTFGGIQRALFDTDFADHVAGARVYWLSANDGVLVGYFNDASTYRVRLLDQTPVSTLDPTAALTDVVTLNRRVFRPAPPDLTTINGSRATPTIGTDPGTAVTVAWRERNRLDTTVTVPSDATETQEAGVTYTVTWQIDNGTLTTITGLTGTSTSVTINAQSGLLKVRVYSVRAGVQSLIGDGCTANVIINTYRLMTSANELLKNSGTDYLRTA